MTNTKQKYNTPSLAIRTNQEDDFEAISESYLGYSEKQTVQTYITIPIDTNIKDASHYRYCTNRIVNTQEGDIVEFEIHSSGGQYNGLTALLGAALRTEATTVAYINGECHSAASMLALSCDEVHVSPFADMLVHFQSFGSAGKSSDIKAFVEHTHNNGAGVFRDIYEFFLTEDEIESCIEGKELWMDSDEIVRRLVVREAMREIQFNECNYLEESMCGDCDEVCEDCDCGASEEVQINTQMNVQVDDVNFVYVKEQDESTHKVDTLAMTRAIKEVKGKKK